MTVPSAMLNAASQPGVPSRSWSWLRRSGTPGIIGGTGWDRSSAWMPGFSSTHSTTALSGGWWYRPATSTTLSTNRGSDDSLNVLVKCGLRPDLRQIRPIVDLDRPVRSAIEARDQCVASCGISSSVAVMTSSTLSSRIDGGRPGRGSSHSPSRRRVRNRLRHLPAVAGSTRRSAATCLLESPSAHASTILARSASAWLLLARRAPPAPRPPPQHRTPAPRTPGQSAPARPASVNCPATSGQAQHGHPRPAPAVRQSPTCHQATELANQFQARDTRTALVVADLPFGSYQAGPEAALANAVRHLKEGGAQAVKLEGGRRVLPQVRCSTGQESR